MQPRRDVVTPGEVAYYHCISRCVRRAFLCGTDSYSKKNFEHRKGWVKERLTLLLSGFGIELAGYAIMSNHLHTILKSRPDLVAKWSDKEIARRWLIIFPKKLPFGDPHGQLAEHIGELAADKEKIAKCRKRLSNISWFQRCLNEHIARRSNKEDNVTGRFWEGRFKCQLLKDEKALLTCNVYIDLNEIRAGVAKTPETSSFSSVYQRIREQTSKKNASEEEFPALLDLRSMYKGKLSFSDYLTVVDESARVYAKGKHSLSSKLDSIVSRLGIVTHEWRPSMNRRYSEMFRRIVGTPEQLREHALRKGKCWFHGMTSGKKLFGVA